MKIIHIGNIKSGIDTYVRNIIDNTNDNFEFVVVNGADDKNQPYIKKGRELKNYHIDLYRALNPYKDLKAILQTIRIIQKEKPDLIHCHSAKGGMVGRIAGWFTHTKTYYTPHAFSFLSTKSRLKRKIFILLERLTKFNSSLLACAESERRLGIDIVGYSEKRAFSWHNCISPVTQSDILQYQGEVCSPYIIAIGRPSYQKNPLLMVEVMNLVHKKYPLIHFYLVGAGYYSPMIKEMNDLIVNYALSDVVHIISWTSRAETLWLLQNSLLLLSTSLYEGLPISVLEALSMGKTLVLTDVLGNNDCVENGTNGYLTGFSPEEIAQKIELLIEDEVLRENMEKASKKIFEDKFIIENRIHLLEELYTIK